MTTLTMAQRELVFDAADNAGIYDDDLRWAYSGRAMYGTTCVGIVGAIGQYGEFLTYIAEQDATFASDLACDTTTDSMGLSTIYYFRTHNAENKETK